MSPLRGVTLAGLEKKYPKNGGVRKANSGFQLTYTTSINRQTATITKTIMGLRLTIKF
jgi:hypothetical protein